MSAGRGTDGGFLRPMPPRDPHEEMRVATPLELFFDLISVVAIAAAAVGLHHAIAGDHAVEGIVRFAMAFFAIWWAWMNYTWFASAYDNGDALFRLLTMMIMAGALVMAAGIDALFKSLDLTMVVIGFVVMRLGMVALWLRAARHDPDHRAACLRYAGGIAAMQVYWVALIFLAPAHAPLFHVLFALGAIGELAVPVWAEHVRITPWHRHHLIERYGLLNIIVLGETILSASMALEKAGGEHLSMMLVHIALAALVVVFSMWWLYFTDEASLEYSDLSRAITWGYGHVVIYASGAAAGAGFAVVVDIVTNHAKVGITVGEFAVAIPVALYLVGLWFVRDRFCLGGAARLVLPVFAALIVLTPLSAAGLGGIALLAALCVIVRHLLVRRQTR